MEARSTSLMMIWWWWLWWDYRVTRRGQTLVVEDGVRHLSFRIMNFVADQKYSLFLKISRTCDQSSCTCILKLNLRINWGTLKVGTRKWEMGNRKWGNKESEEMGRYIALHSDKTAADILLLQSSNVMKSQYPSIHACRGVISMPYSWH